LVWEAVVEIAERVRLVVELLEVVAMPDEKDLIEDEVDHRHLEVRLEGEEPVELAEGAHWGELGIVESCWVCRTGRMVVADTGMVGFDSRLEGRELYTALCRSDGVRYSDCIVPTSTWCLWRGSGSPVGLSSSKASSNISQRCSPKAI
jgi:hypothetical protein